MTQTTETAGERIARAFHEAYERLAPAHGYETREASAKPWKDVPAGNKALMIATVGALLDSGVISAARPVKVDDHSLDSDTRP